MRARTAPMMMMMMVAGACFHILHLNLLTSLLVFVERERKREMDR